MSKLSALEKTLWTINDDSKVDSSRLCGQKQGREEKSGSLTKWI